MHDNCKRLETIERNAYELARTDSSTTCLHKGQFAENI